MKIKIEKLTLNDIEKYKALMDECFDGSNDIKYYKDNYKDDANYTIIVAKDNDKIVGSITFYTIDLFTFSFQPALEIFNVAVLVEYRGKKIAKELFNYIFTYAKENKYKSIYLTCLSDAYPAHRLYESLGFKKAPSDKYSIKVEDI